MGFSSNKPMNYEAGPTRIKSVARDGSSAIAAVLFMAKARIHMRQRLHEG